MNYADIKRVCIDAGHATGNKNYGHGYYEYEGNWRRANALADEFRRRGVEVLMTKTSVSDDPSLTTRGTMAAEFHADLFISIHSDANKSDLMRGVHIIRSIKNPDSVELAKKLVEAVADVMGMPVRDNAVWTRRGIINPFADYYTVINKSANYSAYNPKGTGRNVPFSYLMEIGYHTNAVDAKILANPAYDNKFAKAFADTVLGEERKDYMLRKGDKGTAVKYYQQALEALQYDLGVWGADGSFGGQTEKATMAAQKDFSLKQTGVVDAMLYGLIALRMMAYSERDPQRGEIWKVTGRGWASSYKSGNRTKEYDADRMFVKTIIGDAPAPFGMEKDGFIVGWFEREQLS